MIVRDRPTGWVKRLPTHDGLLLLDTASDSLLAYNDSARHIWELLGDGLRDDDMTSSLARRYAISEDVARRDLRSILLDWRSRGIVEAGDARLSVVRGKDDRPTATDWAQAPKPSWAMTLTCTIRDKVVTFFVERSRTEDIQILFGHLETPHAKTDVRLELREVGDGALAVVANDVERVRTHEGALVIGAIHQAILDHIYPAVDWLALGHGGGVARDGKAFVVSAYSGSGKTTLIAYLIARRGFSYLADDLIAITAADGRMVPWPLPLSVKEGSWHVLADSYEGLERFPRFRTARGESRQIVPPRSTWDAAPMPVQGILFPRYQADAEPRLTRISQFEALQRFLSDRVWLGYPITEAKVARFLEWLDNTPAYTLVHGNVVEAAGCIEDLP